MLDFKPIHARQLSVFDLVQRDQIAAIELPRLTNEMLDHMLNSIADCVDADVTFVPADPNAHDMYATDLDEIDLAWTLGHVIVHVTASSEEAAFLAAEVARGVPWRGGRARYEVPWRTITTIQQCRDRLEESRQMRLASLELWPRPPHLENTYSPREGITHNCVSRFVAGLVHDDAHLQQIDEIVRQARAARVPA